MVSRPTLGGVLFIAVSIIAGGIIGSVVGLLAWLLW